jgi:hypothetical protein
LIAIDTSRRCDIAGVRGRRRTDQGRERQRGAACGGRPARPVAAGAGVCGLGRGAERDIGKDLGLNHATVNGILETWHFQADAFITRGKNGKVDKAYRDMLSLNQKQVTAVKDHADVVGRSDGETVTGVSCW